uniref:dual specificity protein kinase zak2-like n=1 Tax=Erigeron canadensis TaxID=72917 RepID=UPI001CB95104|nr:dual specificity protein kinase zak2-like [Erigeron canadensis]
MAGSKPSTSNYTSVQWSQPCRQIDYPEILLATENFNESLVIGCGGFGNVYKGNINNGSKLVVAAIKRLDSMSNQGETEFWAEVEMLSKLRHAYLVSLIGYCSYEKEFILVYEYMPNGALGDHLHKLGTRLSWRQRLWICIGAGRGLDYLHTGTGIEFGVIHRDVKSSNILLNERWAAKVSDFGLSKISPANQPSTYVNTLIKGTFGYVDPNYFATGKLTRKSDVYAFGVVLLEILCRKRPLDPSLDLGFATWAQDSIKEGNLKNIIDYDIKSQISPKCLKEFVRITQRCLDNHPKNRPTMGEVVVGLESILTLQEKIDNSLQTTGKTLFGRMIDMFPFPSKPENSDIIISSRVNEAGDSPFIHLAMARFLHDMEREKPTQFTSQQLRIATDNFTIKLGSGGFGAVYKGIIGNNTLVAVKVLNGTSDESIIEQQFIAEMSTMGRTYHFNLVRLYGFCFESNLRALVYEFMVNGSLDHYLFKPEKKTVIGFEKLHEIALGTARGLTYLHEECPQRIVHYDIKPGNILLDSNFCAKVADFGLAELCNRDSSYTTMAGGRGTPGYAAPELWMDLPVTHKCDVYSFGMLLFEIIGRRNNMDTSLGNSQEWFPVWTWGKYEKKQLEDLMIACQIAKEDEEVAERMIKVALCCVQYKPEARPLMSIVVQMLEGTLQVPEPPNPFTHIISGDSEAGDSFTQMALNFENSDWSSSEET